MPATDEQKAIRSVLRYLLISGEEWMRKLQTGSEAATAITNVATGIFSPIGQQQLDNHILYGRKCGQFHNNEAIYIKPPAKEKSAVAAIRCYWNFDLEPAKCTFYFGIWSYQLAFPQTDVSDKCKYPAFLGFRYETPEIGENHNYYHVQPCRSMGIKDDLIIHAIPISVRNPTWPLPACSSLDLLLCLVTSLYGMNGLSELAKKAEEDLEMRQDIKLRKSIENISDIQITP